MLASAESSNDLSEPRCSVVQVGIGTSGGEKRPTTGANAALGRNAIGMGQTAVEVGTARDVAVPDVGDVGEVVALSQQQKLMHLKTAAAVAEAEALIVMRVRMLTDEGEDAGRAWGNVRWGVKGSQRALVVVNWGCIKGVRRPGSGATARLRWCGQCSSVGKTTLSGQNGDARCSTVSRRGM